MCAESSQRSRGQYEQPQLTSVERNAHLGAHSASCADTMDDSSMDDVFDPAEIVVRSSCPRVTLLAHRVPVSSCTYVFKIAIVTVFPTLRCGSGLETHSSWPFGGHIHKPKIPFVRFQTFPADAVPRPGPDGMKVAWGGKADILVFCEGNKHVV